MHIIFGRDVAEELRNRHSVLELETFQVEDRDPVTAFCVVPAEAIALGEMPDIERYSRIHQALVDAWNRQDYVTVAEGIAHLKGKFGGELESFYEIIESRIKDTAQ
jgi:hypothetical protein